LGFNRFQGFLGFSRHCGVLARLQTENIVFDRIVGTSSGNQFDNQYDSVAVIYKHHLGALVGALVAAGYHIDDIIYELKKRVPARYLGTIGIINDRNHLIPSR
jgi:predicted acylesterase/phospholipase RssA